MKLRMKIDLIALKKQRKINFFLELNSRNKFNKEIKIKKRMKPEIKRESKFREERQS